MVVVVVVIMMMILLRMCGNFSVRTLRPDHWASVPMSSAGPVYSAVVECFSTFDTHSSATVIQPRNTSHHFRNDRKTEFLASMKA